MHGWQQRPGSNCNNMPTRSRRGFSLIELLVVISILAVLASILTPMVRQSIYQGQLGGCISNLSEIYKVSLQYSVDHKSGAAQHIKSHPIPELLWRFNASTVDAPFESNNKNQPGNPARALYRNGYLQDGRVFFCPLVPIPYEAVFDPECPWDAGLYWGTYIWRWRPIRRADDPHRDICENSIYRNNPESRSLVISDTYTSFWEKRGYPYRLKHHNGAFIDGSVRQLATDETELRTFLYGPELKPNNGYPL